MNNWHPKKISEVLNIINGGTPSTSNPDYWEGDIPWLSVEDFNTGKRFVRETKKTITEQGLRQSATKLLKTNDIILSARGTVGAIAQLAIPMTFNQSCYGLTPKTSDIDINFAYYSLSLHVPALINKSYGSVFDAITRKSFDLVQIPFPDDQKHQQKIAKILTTVDELIEKTEGLIAKYQAVKQGMMHDLFTLGVDEHGHLRPSYEEAPHLYHETPLGWLPKDWEVKALGIITRERGGSIQTGPFGSQLHASDYKEEGVPIITVEHLGDSVILHSNLPLVGDEDRLRLIRYALAQGDLVFSRVGAIDRCAYVSCLEDGWLFSGRCLRVRLGSGLDSKYFCYQLNSYYPRQWILNNAVGSTMKCLNTSILSGVPIAVPTRKGEQEAISERLDTLSETIKVEQDNLSKYVQLKKGLMQDLLTGKVPVHVDEAEEALEGVEALAGV